MLKKVHPEELYYNCGARYKTADERYYIVNDGGYYYLYDMTDDVMMEFDSLAQIKEYLLSEGY